VGPVKNEGLNSLANFILFTENYVYLTIDVLFGGFTFKA